MPISSETLLLLQVFLPRCHDFACMCTEPWWIQFWKKSCEIEILRKPTVCTTPFYLLASHAERKTWRANWVSRCRSAVLRRSSRVWRSWSHMTINYWRNIFQNAKAIKMTKWKMTCWLLFYVDAEMPAFELWVRSWKFMRLWICCALRCRDTPCSSMTHLNPMLNQIQPAGLLVGSACGPAHGCTNKWQLQYALFENVLQLKNLLDMGKITAGDLQPSFQIYGVHQTKKKVAWKECIFRWCSYKPWGTACWGWNLGSILDGFGRFFSLRMSAVMCFLSSLVSLRKHGGPYTMTMLWSGLVWGQKNARFSHAIHRRHSWFAFLFVEIIAPLKFGSTSQYPSYIDPQKKLKHWMWPGNLRTVPSGCKQKKNRPQWHVSDHQLLEPHFEH